MKIVFGLVGIIIIVLFCISIARANNLADMGKISRLEADMFQVRSELSQIKAELGRLGRISHYNRANSNNATPAIIIPPQTTNDTLADAPAFKRLATLVIELKERITILEKKYEASDR